MVITGVADAIAAMDYLHRRKLLCDRCGIRVAEIHNALHSRCHGCRPPHGEFKEVSHANEFERRLCDAVRDWVNSDSGSGEAEAGPCEPGA